MKTSRADATRVLLNGGSMVELAEAIGVVISDPESTLDEIRLGLQHPGFVAEQAALALSKRQSRSAGTKVLVKVQKLTGKGFGFIQTGSVDVSAIKPEH